MLSRNWLESVERELSQKNLPRREIARLVAELADHLADALDLSRALADQALERSTVCVSESHFFTENAMSMEANVIESLGSPAEIASVAVREFQRRKPLLSRSWVAAACAFLLLPLPALLLAWCAALAIVYGIGAGLEWLDIPDPVEPHSVTASLVMITYVLLHAVVLAPAAGVAVLFARLARKTSSVWRWGLSACVVVALITSCARLDATFSEVPGKSTMMMGLGVGRTIPWSALGQFMIPLATGVLALRRANLVRAETT
jgi:hypothetical protein